MSIEGDLKRLLRLATLRARSQRFADAAASALVVVLAATAIAISLSKWGWLTRSELWLIVVAGALVVLAVGAIAASLPLAKISLLIKLDAANQLPDRLSSAWDFLQTPVENRAPEMELHLERASRDAAEARVAPAFPYRWPVDTKLLLTLGVLVGLVTLIKPPSYDPLAEVEPPEPYAEVIVDTGRLLEDMRNIEILDELAARSDDPELQAISRELNELGNRLQNGTISEDEMLNILDDLEERIAALDEPDEPIELGSVWEDLAEELGDALDELGIERGTEARERAESLLTALEEGDTEAIAEAMNDLADLLEQMDLDVEDEEALAELLERFADMVDPTDIDLRREMEQYAEQIAELEQRVADRGRQRDQRRLDQAREALAEAGARLDEERQNQDASGEVRQDLADALQNAADELRPEQLGQTGDEERQEDAENSEPGEQEDLTEDDGREVADPSGEETGNEETNSENTPQTDENQQESSDAERDRGEQTGQEQAGTESPETAADSLREAAETIDQLDQQEASQEGRERAEQATADLRENLQRSSHGESNDNEELAENWESFMDRADGQELGAQDGQSGEQGGSEVDEEGQGSWQSDQQTPEDPDSSQEGWGSESGGDPQGEETAALDSERTRERVSVSGDDDELTSSEVFQDVATSGFSSTSYREIYAEYAQAAEEVLEADEIPRGYIRFVQQYFRLVEPR